jgi:hypothetical protein
MNGYLARSWPSGGDLMVCTSAMHSVKTLDWNVSLFYCLVLSQSYCLWLFPRCEQYMQTLYELTWPSLLTKKIPVPLIYQFPRFQLQRYAFGFTQSAARIFKYTLLISVSHCHCMLILYLSKSYVSCSSICF